MTRARVQRWDTGGFLYMGPAPRKDQTMKTMRLDEALRTPGTSTATIIALEAEERGDIVTARYWRADSHGTLPPGWTASSAREYINARGGVVEGKLNSAPEIRGALSVVLASEINDQRIHGGNIAKALGRPAPAWPQPQRSDGYSSWPLSWSSQRAYEELEALGIKTTVGGVPIAAGGDLDLACTLIEAYKSSTSRADGSMRTDKAAIKHAWDNQHLKTLAAPPPPPPTDAERIAWFDNQGRAPLPSQGK